MKLISLDILPKSDELPTEFRLFKYGSNAAYKLGHGDFDIPFTPEDAVRVLKAFEDTGEDLCIDYEHASLMGAPMDTSAAGWITRLEIRDDGIWACDVEWTPRASQKLKDREFKYYSPSVEMDDDEEEMLRLLPCALTNMPALKQLQALMNSQITNTNLSNDSLDQKGLNMKTETDEFETSILALTGAKDKKEAIQLLSAYKAATEQVKALSARVEELETEKTATEINALLDKAIAEGRLEPAKREEIVGYIPEIGVKGLKLMLSCLPVKTPKESTAPAVTPVQLSATPNRDEKLLASILKLSPEALAKAKEDAQKRLEAVNGKGK